MKNPRSDVLDEVFERFLQGSDIFRDRDVLRHDYIPSKLPHRESEIRYLGEIVAPALKGSPFSNVLIYGKTGTGKTAVMRYVLSMLKRKAEQLGSPMKARFVNCRLTGTEYRVFSNLCSAIGVRVPFTGLALGEVFDRFKEGLDSKKLLLIVVLDEIDAIVKNRGDFLLYELTRINESLTKSKVTIIGISNDLRFKELLDPRVLSTLSEEEILFKPYNADELRDILVERAELAFCSGVLSDGAIRLCSALAAAEHGDARRALDLLRVAGELAEREGSGSVSEAHVRRAEKRIEHDRISEALKNLPTHSKIVMLSVYLLSRAEAGHSVTGNIYNVYCELCQEMGIIPLTQRRVSGLINELDVIGLLNTRVVSLGRYGRTKKIHLAIPRSFVRNVFCEDDRFGSLVDYAPRYLASSMKRSARMRF
ncbi:MAG: ORC1-type DNA replication protein [Candidatus Bathyarchaeia archaeon]